MRFESLASAFMRRSALSTPPYDRRSIHGNLSNYISAVEIIGFFSHAVGRAWSELVTMQN